MKSLLSLLLLFIVIINLVNSQRKIPVCTKTMIERCCEEDCVGAYCDEKTGRCACGNGVLHSDQCHDDPDNVCTAEEINTCCALDCLGPYCDPKTGTCACGNGALHDDQCHSD